MWVFQLLADFLVTCGPGRPLPDCTLSRRSFILPHSFSFLSTKYSGCVCTYVCVYMCVQCLGPNPEPWECQGNKPFIWERNLTLGRRKILPGLSHVIHFVFFLNKKRKKKAEIWEETESKRHKRQCDRGQGSAVIPGNDLEGSVVSQLSSKNQNRNKTRQQTKRVSALAWRVRSA